MPREPEVQAQAKLGGRNRARSSAGVSPFVVVGIVALAASLVAVGAIVVFNSFGPGPFRPPDPTPTTARATPGMFTVGRQDPQPPDGSAAPTALPTITGSGGAAQDPAGGPQTLQTP